ncbi:carboxypeptidase regulatory-like domain-containing protein [Candidatus Poribacteria bacterium]|nr:carboxypeptidase regulatory-like domain-containing protein [Candidatus Poribacteria bacterium]
MCRIGYPTSDNLIVMNRPVQISILLICILLIASCTESENTKVDLLPRTTPGSINGNISPINVYDAEVTVLQAGEVIAVVGVDDGIFRIDNLLPGAYDLRVSALGYVTNDAIRSVQVVAGETVEVGRAVIYPQDASGYTPTQLTGMVLDADKGVPIADASIEIECTEGLCSTIESTSNPDGRFEVAIWANLASIVIVEKEGYRTARVEVVGIPTATAKSIEVKLQKINK